jgi:Glycosyl transferase family 2
MTGPAEKVLINSQPLHFAGNPDLDGGGGSGSGEPKKLNRVAVLICVHADADPTEFDQALASMKTQTYSDLRLYVYCDGPLQPAHEEVLSFRLDTSSGRDHIVRGDRPAGLPTGLNALIDRAMADPQITFLARMDADDISLPERVERQVQFFRQHFDVSIVGTWCVEFTQQNVPLYYKVLPTSDAEIKKFMLFRNPLAHPSVMFRRSVFEDGYRYDAKCIINQDYELWSRLLVAGYRISNVPEFLLWFRVGNSFFSRRGYRRAIADVTMRIQYAKRSNLMHPFNYIKYVALFALRISPLWIKKIAYLRLR